MPNFLKKLYRRKKALDAVSSSLSFPWNSRREMFPLENSFGKRVASDIFSPAEYPPFTRSLRDGYAVSSADLQGVSPSSPTFLTVSGEVPMGEISEVHGVLGTAMHIYTGGHVPPGFDSVVMEEDVLRTEKTIEVRKSAPSGSYVVFQGEELQQGVPLLRRGEYVDFTNAGILASAGIREIPVSLCRIGIISTGDEIRPFNEKDLPHGCVRDSNGWMLFALFQRWGAQCKHYGVVPDSIETLQETLLRALEVNDVLLISGGSSVSTRDFCEHVFQNTFRDPGLLVHGINIKPGKPTLVAGDRDNKKVAFGLPGHPFSCMVVALTVVRPLLERMTGQEISSAGIIRGQLAQDVLGKTGVEEYIPCVFSPEGYVIPKQSRSGYISALKDMTGMIRLQEHEETLRSGDFVEVFLW